MEVLRQAREASPAAFECAKTAFVSAHQICIGWTIGVLTDATYKECKAELLGKFEQGSQAHRVACLVFDGGVIEVAGETAAAPELPSIKPPEVLKEEPKEGAPKPNPVQAAPVQPAPAPATTAASRMFGDRPTLVEYKPTLIPDDDDDWSDEETPAFEAVDAAALLAETVNIVQTAADSKGDAEFRKISAMRRAEYGQVGDMQIASSR
ncbi:hypothetical protein CYMTET_39381 [Cymbomonas tetramitiformis]|uniref:Uncharacterized protein n=1 Tax=Cymbomonas tetramitiformis TaxID=36881 RepID=A0AAE0CA72_9CHLO|nr:hypothetical protein CYMTET_39381 [Cymbomonas tetramitiformis]